MRQGSIASVVILVVVAVVVMVGSFLVTVHSKNSKSNTGVVTGSTNDYAYCIIDFRSGRYSARPVLAVGDRMGERIDAIAKRTNAIAVIGGTYWDLAHKPLGDIVYEGKVISRGGQRQGIGFTSKGRIVFRERKRNGKINWRGCVSGIACGPRLLRDGRIDSNYSRDGFGPGAGTLEAKRCAVGATRNGKLVLCAAEKPITLRTLSKIMLKLGAVDAINLDGGVSCALYADGKMLVEPLFPMHNVLVVTKTR